jgi:hypothetical protein
LISTYSETINPGSIANINLNIPSGVHTIQVSSTSTQSFTRQVSVPQTCTGVQPPSNGDWAITSDTTCTCASGENITIVGKVSVQGSATFNLNNCYLFIIKDSDPAFEALGSTKTNIINSKLNISPNQHAVDFSNTINYIENSIFDECGSGCNLQTSSINTIKNTQFLAPHYMHIRGNSQTTFDNVYMYEIRCEAQPGTAIVKGNFTFQVLNGGFWPSDQYINRYFPVIITDSISGNPKSATVNITNKTNGALIWGPQSVNGYAEPNITFNSTNYVPGNFILYVYTISIYKVNSTDLNFLNTTPIKLSL